MVDGLKDYVSGDYYNTPDKISNLEAKLNAALESKSVKAIAFDVDNTITIKHTGGYPMDTFHDPRNDINAFINNYFGKDNFAGLCRMISTLVVKGIEVYIVSRGIRNQLLDLFNLLKIDKDGNTFLSLIGGKYHVYGANEGRNIYIEGDIQNEKYSMGGDRTNKEVAKQHNNMWAEFKLNYLTRISENKGYTKPGNILFFDDTQVNIAEVEQTENIIGICVNGRSGLNATLAIMNKLMPTLDKSRPQSPSARPPPPPPPPPTARPPPPPPYRPASPPASMPAAPPSTSSLETTSSMAESTPLLSTPGSKPQSRFGRFKLFGKGKTNNTKKNNKPAGPAGPSRWERTKKAASNLWSKMPSLPSGKLNTNIVNTLPDIGKIHHPSDYLDVNYYKYAKNYVIDKLNKISLNPSEHVKVIAFELDPLSNLIYGDKTVDYIKDIGISKITYNPSRHLFYSEEFFKRLCDVISKLKDKGIQIFIVTKYVRSGVIKILQSYTVPGSEESFLNFIGGEEHIYGAYVKDKESENKYAMYSMHQIYKDSNLLDLWDTFKINYITLIHSELFKGPDKNNNKLLFFDTQGSTITDVDNKLPFAIGVCINSSITYRNGIMMPRNIAATVGFLEFYNIAHDIKEISWKNKLKAAASSAWSSIKTKKLSMPKFSFKRGSKVAPMPTSTAGTETVKPSSTSSEISAAPTVNKWYHKAGRSIAKPFSTGWEWTKKQAGNKYKKFQTWRSKQNNNKSSNTPSPSRASSTSSSRTASFVSMNTPVVESGRNSNSGIIFEGVKGELPASTSARTQLLTRNEFTAPLPELPEQNSPGRPESRGSRNFGNQITVGTEEIFESAPKNSLHSGNNKKQSAPTPGPGIPTNRPAPQRRRLAKPRTPTPVRNVPTLPQNRPTTPAARSSSANNGPKNIRTNLKQNLPKPTPAPRPPATSSVGLSSILTEPVTKPSVFQRTIIRPAPQTSNPNNKPPTKPNNKPQQSTTNRPGSPRVAELKQFFETKK